MSDLVLTHPHAVAVMILIVISLVMNLISQGNLPYAEAVAMVASTRRIALKLFPGKETAFDIIYQPKLKRLLNEVYRIQ